MNLIAAADENWAIGNRGKLLVRIPDDHRFFREMTTGKVVVMGRKTLESLPGGRPLPGRTNIVLSKRRDYCADGAQIVHSLEECMGELARFAPADIFVIGGECVYRAFLPYAKVIYITKIHAAYEADTHFPDLTREAGWALVQESEAQTYGDLHFSFQRYEKQVNSLALEESL